MREKLVTLAKDRNIQLRQSYVRKGKDALMKQSRYAHAKQYKRAAIETRQLMTYLGRVYRDINQRSVCR